MNKRLLLVRHAKSDWDDPALADFERPLNNRGHKIAPQMATRLLKKDLQPHLLVSSPALRAISTANYFADVFGMLHSDILQKKEIYEATSSALQKLVNNFDNQFDYIMLIGHNPGLTDLCVKLANAHVYNIPTCGMAMIEFAFEDWNLVSSGTGRLVFFDYPKKQDD